MNIAKWSMIAALGIGLGALGCGKGKDEDKGKGKGDQTQNAKPTDDKAKPAPPAKPVELVEIDLSAAEIAATMKAPKGAKVEESFGSAKVTTADGGFQLEVGTEKADMAKRKEEIGANDINKLKKYVVDEPAAILYESEVMGKTEYHLLVNAEGGESGFMCEDVKGPTYTEAQARTMVEACKSIQAKAGGDGGEGGGEEAGEGDEGGEAE